MTFMAKVGARRSLLAKGYSRSQVRDALDAVDSDAVDAAALVAGVSLPPEVVEGMAAPTPGTHPILDAILAFLQSPQGQALIAALVQMLIHMIGG